MLNSPQDMMRWLLLPPFQNVGRFDFYRFIYFAMNLDIYYIEMHNKHYESKKTKMTYILERREYHRVTLSSAESITEWHSLQLVLEFGIIMKRDNYMKKPLHLVLKVENSSPPHISTWASCYLLPPSPHCPRTTPPYFVKQLSWWMMMILIKEKCFFTWS